MSIFPSSLSPKGFSMRSAPSNPFSLILLTALTAFTSAPASESGEELVSFNKRPDWMTPVLIDEIMALHPDARIDFVGDEKSGSVSISRDRLKLVKGQMINGGWHGVVIRVLPDGTTLSHISFCENIPMAEVRSELNGTVVNCIFYAPTGVPIRQVIYTRPGTTEKIVISYDKNGKVIE